MSSKTELPEYTDVTLPREEVEKLYKIKSRYETNKKIAKLGLGVFLFFVACLVLQSGPVVHGVKSLTHPHHPHAHGFHGAHRPPPGFEGMHEMEEEVKPFKDCKMDKKGGMLKAHKMHKGHKSIKGAEGELRETEHEFEIEEHKAHDRPHHKGMKLKGHKGGEFSKKKQDKHLMEDSKEKLEKEPKDEEEKVEKVEKGRRQKHKRPAKAQEEVHKEAFDSQSESESENEN
ncbi:hypothetical protein KL905_003592 [Ogataea polymorpha]|uniref:Uncharacterized protein n=1 Tax=Ogataea polymorpha TaxID=460523 RepID=A0A9P8NUD0_9ASCO|nr:hypothetical protein KL908_003681 [Ogataea polymorpha]KAG7904548.1 hypothetical protein KL907_003424 [Ogataea polymorpha]KAG7907675.1 hypothetical protein KL906_003756 [Ogataea polymorpha]KAG7919727.1 hypothetical protein KL905_003592 [Ogataea polymorpha]KAH3659807.1 hypothetical protein OGATHE_005852 [Ogataea polymorpha]